MDALPVIRRTTQSPSGHVSMSSCMFSIVSHMFARWGAAVTRRSKIILVAVAVTAVAAGVYGFGVFGSLSQGGYVDPGSESAQALELSQEDPRTSSPDVIAMYPVADGDAVTSALAELPDEHIASVRSYWNSQDPSLRSEDGSTGLVAITLSGDGSDEKNEAFDAVESTLEIDGVQTRLAGTIPLEAGISAQVEHDLIMAEAVSLPVVLVLLILIFGGLVAAALPVAVGGLSVLAALGVLHGVATVTTVSEFAVNVASLLGLGMAIDYGLFIVSRFREELGTGVAPPDAVRRTVASAGRTVAFSATLLMIALSTLLLFPQDFLKSLAYGGVAAVALAAVMSLTVLPAALALLGGRVNALSLRRRGRAANPEPSRFWGRLADAVMRRPLLVATPIVAGLAVLIVPFFDAQFGQPDERILPDDHTARASVEVLDEQFPALSDDTIRVVLDTRDTSVAPPDIEQFSAQVAGIEGVSDVTPAGPLTGGIVVLDAQYEGDTYGDTANTAVDGIRALSPPGDAVVLVGGLTSSNADSLDAIGDRLPVMITILVGATLVLMFLAFGSVVLPIKAAIMSAVSLTATFGVLTWIFVDGHGAGFLNVTPQPMEVGTVVLMAAVVFGLSTDYEVFLLSRIVEAHAQGASTAEAVREGLTRSGRVITAAALLLIVVVGAFSLSGIQMMRFIGVGMIIALALDATVIRMLLVPALLKLLGRANWWGWKHSAVGYDKV